MDDRPTPLPMGASAVLVDHVAAPAAYAAAVQRLAREGVLEGVVEVVPAAATVLVVFASPPDLEVVVPTLRSIGDEHDTTATEAVVEVPTRYDGADLAAVAATTGMTVEAVVNAHSSVEFVVSFCGFAPGFAYLAGLPAELHLPRRATPRTRVPAGSVAIAAGYSAVYPRESPGGWHLIGSTRLRLFDVERDPPALLSPGTRVRFVAA